MVRVTSNCNALLFEVTSPALQFSDAGTIVYSIDYSDRQDDRPTALGQFLRTTITTQRVTVVPLNQAELLQCGQWRNYKFWAPG